MLLVLFVACWLQVWTGVAGYSTGAPVSRCGDMTPGHNVTSQTSPSPYTIKVSNTTFSTNQMIKGPIRIQPDRCGDLGATIVTNKTTFWINLKSETLNRVGGNNAAADPKVAVTPVLFLMLMSTVFQSFIDAPSTTSR
ncbi:hypothetical protein C0J50_0431 [Silurus asotus]|uniref:Reelin domain-containing protein n=1 Tax=Silurus asotus TaxID=30991 RepID=A0AAD5AGQ0_SILAS|nr:hypothetical protein C0J50_0431 [Silurus asotus]